MSRRKLPGDWITRADGSQAWRLPYRTPEGRQTSRHVRRRTGAARETSSPTSQRRHP